MLSGSPYKEEENGESSSGTVPNSNGNSSSILVLRRYAATQTLTTLHSRLCFLVTRKPAITLFENSDFTSGNEAVLTNLKLSSTRTSSKMDQHPRIGALPLPSSVEDVEQVGDSEGQITYGR